MIFVNWFENILSILHMMTWQYDEDYADHDDYDHVNHDYFDQDYDEEHNDHGMLACNVWSVETVFPFCHSGLSSALFGALSPI